MTHQHMEQRPSAFWQQLGRRCIHITWSSRGAITLEEEGLSEYDAVSEPEEADFILIHGTEALAQPGGGCSERSVEQLLQLLERCARRGGLPLICANPDLVR